MTSKSKMKSPKKAIFCVAAAATMSGSIPGALSLALSSTSGPLSKQTNHDLSTVERHSFGHEMLHSNHPTRRSFLSSVALVSAVSMAGSNPLPAQAVDLQLQTAPSGLQWADAKLGTGQALSPGTTATVDYVLSTTGARYGAKIYASGEQPYRWKLGDGSTIAGVEQAILGDGSSIPPLLPGGVRRIIIPQSLGYSKLATSTSSVKQFCVENGTPGPIPPPSTAFEEYQRFKNIYCNPNRQYQPDIVMDIKLYGARSAGRR